MKKYTLLFIFTLLLINLHAQKRFNVGFKAGVSTSQVEGDSYSGFNKAGLDAGIFMVAKLKKNFTAQLEMIFIQKGSKHNSNPDNNDYSYYYMGLNYVEVPVLLQYRYKQVGVEAGPVFGYLISSKEYNENGPVYMPIPFEKDEVAVATAIVWHFYKNFSFDWRYENSVFAIRKFASGESRWYNPGQRNNVLAFTLTYQFGGDDGKTE